MTDHQPGDPLKRAAAHRRVSAESRATQAIHSLDQRGETITFAAVAAAAGVSRQYLYSHPQLRPEIEQLRGRQRTAPSRLPASDRPSDTSLRSRLRAALDDNQRLREDNTALREELAVALGRVREFEVARRARASP
jgi:hypothetical protein